MFFLKKKYPYTTNVYIDGMSCGHCAARVEAAIADVADCDVKVDLDEKCAVVKSKEPLCEKSVFDAVSAIGFKPVRMETK